MSPTIPVTTHFVTELILRMRGSGISWAAALREMSTARDDDDDCTDVELAPTYPNGAGPLLAPLLSVRW